MRYPLPWLETMSVCGHHQTFIKYNSPKFVQTILSKRKTIKYLGTLNIKIEKKAFTDFVYLLLIFFPNSLHRQICTDFPRGKSSGLPPCSAVDDDRSRYIRREIKEKPNPPFFHSLIFVRGLSGSSSLENRKNKTEEKRWSEDLP